MAKCFSLCRTTALAKNGPFALGKSDPREEHDLSQGKKKASAGEMLLFLVARSFFPNQFVFPSAQRPTGASCLAGKRLLPGGLGGSLLASKPGNLSRAPNGLQASQLVRVG